jgi:hypothetical protein
LACWRRRITDPASFFYHQILSTGQTSSARHFVFNDPMAQLFTFDAVVKARVQVDPQLATCYQPEPGIDLSRFDFATFSETFQSARPAEFDVRGPEGVPKGTALHAPTLAPVKALTSRVRELISRGSLSGPAISPALAIGGRHRLSSGGRR